MIRERILFRLFFSLLLLLSFSPFCTYEPTSQIHPSSLQAARKLVRDFDLSPDKPPSGTIALPKPPAALSDAQQEDIAYCLRVLHDYRDLLTRWRTEFAPRSPGETLDDRFVEALHMLATVDDLIDRLAFGPASQKATAAKRLLDGQLLPRMETRPDTIKAKEAA